MNLFSLATRGVDLDALPTEEQVRTPIAFDPPSRVSAPAEFDKLFADAGDAYGVDPAILKSIAFAESGFQPEIISGQRKSKAGAIGMMQFMPETAKEYGIDPTNPVEAVFGAAAYMRHSLDKFDGDYGKAVASYNAGRNRKDFDAEDWDTRLPAETQGYLAKVFGVVDKFKPQAPQTPAADPAYANNTSDETARLAARYPAKATREVVPDMTVGSVAQDTLASALAVGPTVLKGLGELSSLATGGRVGQEFANDMQKRMDTVTSMVGSERGAAQKRNFQRDMADDSVSVGDVLLRNKGAMVDMALPSLGSMLLPVGAAGAAGKLATVGKVAQGLDKAALAARVASVQQAAGIGAVAAQNAASTFAELVDKGVSLPDAYTAAGITVPFSLIAGKLTGGGAEGALIKGLGKGGAAEAIKRGVAEVPKAMVREGGQEVGEEAGQALGEAYGTKETPSMQAVGKRLAVAGTMGAVVGGGMNVAEQGLSMKQAPTVESQPTTPQAPITPPNPGITPPNPAVNPVQSGNTQGAQAVDQIQAILEAERNADQGTTVTPNQPASDAGTAAVNPTGNEGATEGAGGNVEAAVSGQPESSQALTQPSNFTATPAATVGTQETANAGPGFTATGIAAEMAALKARSQPQAQPTAPTAPKAAPVAPVSPVEATTTQPSSLAAEMGKIKGKKAASTEPAGLLTNDERKMLGDFERLYQSDVKGEIRQRLGMAPKETTEATSAPKRTSALLSMIVQAGGIKSGLSNDLTGGNAMEGNKRYPGLFRRNGQNLDTLVQSLKERGFLTQADEDNILDNGGVNKLADMVQAELSGERAKLVDNTDGLEQQRDNAMRSDMEDKASALGLSPDLIASMSNDRLNGTLKRIEARLGYPIKTDFATRKMSRAEARAEREAILMADRVERARQKYDADLQAFAESDDRIQDAALDVFTDENGDVVIVNERDADAELAARTLNGSWSDQNGQETATTQDSGTSTDTREDRAPVARGSDQGTQADQGNGSEAGSGSQEALTTYTAAEATAKQEAKAKAEREAKARKDAEERTAKNEDERKRIAQASVKAADTFELGQDPLDSLTGQQGLKFSRRANPRTAAIKEMLDAEAALDEVRKGDPNKVTLQSWMALSDRSLNAKKALTAELAKIPDDGFALQAQASGGRSVILTPSAQQPGRWQLTRFDANGAPWGDTNYDTKEQALRDFIDEADLSTLVDGAGLKFSKSASKEVRNLVTLHNLSEENLLYAGKMGGIPVPSIGITKVDSPFGGFGNITLIAPKGMIDPGNGTPVYDRDAWTARFPTLNFKKVKAKVADAFYERMKPVREMGDDGQQFLSMLWEEMRNASVQRPDKITSLFTRYDAARLFYAKEVLGKTIKIPMRPTKPRTAVGHDKILAAYWEKNGSAFTRAEQSMSGPDFINAPEKIAFDDAIREAIGRYADRPDADDALKAYLAKSITDQMFPINMNGYDRLIKDFKTIGQKEIDGPKLRDAVRKLVPDNDPAYLKWVGQQVEPLFEAPTITVRGREVPVTLDNIVDAMTVGATAGAEKSMTFSSGKVAAMLGKQFKSIDEIKAARDQVVSAKVESEGKKATDALLDEYRQHVSQFYTNKDWRGNIDTWAANDDSMEALAKAGKLPASDANIRGMLSRMGFKGVDQRGVDLARQSIEALRNAATDYFEAKPQRAVKLNEFKGAVAPKETSPEAIAILEQNGIAVEMYGKTEGAREKAIQKLAKRIDKERGDVLFSKGQKSPQTPITTIAQAITKAYGNALTRLQSKGLVSLTQTEEDALKAAADARAAKNGTSAEVELKSLRASVLASQRAWHGTPHRGIEKFSTDKIGTGEGAQAFGWGLYFADKRELAEVYRRKLTAIDGSPARQSGDDSLQVKIGRLEQEIRNLEKDDSPSSKAMIAAYRKRIAELNKQGQLYEVDIPNDTDMLLWDKPLSEQNPAFNAAMRKAAAELADTELRDKVLPDVQREQAKPVEITDDYLSMFSADNASDSAAMDRAVNERVQSHPDREALIAKYVKTLTAPDRSSGLTTGKSFYESLAKQMGQQRASEYLAGLGLKGIKYLDGQSRNKALRDVKREFLAELPEDADFAEVMDLLGTGTFSDKNEAVIKALAESDWLGFDYPSQAISTALSSQLQNFDPSPELLQAVTATQDDSTYNYVIFSGDDVQIVDVKYSADGQLQGFFDPATGQSFLVADNLTAETAPAVFAHEVGIHMAADGKLQPVFDRATTILATERTSPFVQRVQDRMDQSGETSGEEAAAYIVEEYERDRTNAPASVTKWVKDFIASVRAWLFNKGVMLKADQLTVADIAAIARANVKSLAKGDAQTDPSSPDIRRSIGPAQQSFINPTQQWQMPELPPDSSKLARYFKPKLERFVYEIQDQRIDLKNTQAAIKAAGRAITENFDARQAETLMPGRVAFRTETFLKTEAAPLMEAMAKNNVSQNELSDYLLARHAPERNAQIAKVNPDMPDGGAGTNSQGVLMTTQAANDHIAALTTGKKLVLDMLAKKVDAMTKGTQDLLVREGLEKQSSVDAWNAAYKHYVPLFKDEAADTTSHPIGSGLSVTGSASKRATGSEGEVTNMVAHLLMQREAAIVRAEKNRVAMALYGLALSNPNPDMWTTVRPTMSAEKIGRELAAMGVDPVEAESGMQGVPTIRSINQTTGQVQDTPNPMYKRLDNALVVKVGGEDRVILFNKKNPTAARMAGALKNLDGLSNLNLAGSIVGKTTRFMASMSTQYNPAFGMVNVVRDVGGALVNLSSTELKGQQAKVLGNVPAALKGIARDLEGKQRTPWSDLWQQFQEDGGRTGYRDIFNSPFERAAAVQKDIDRMQDEGKWTAGNAAHAVLDLLDNFNTSLENAVRLSAYKAALDSGMSRAQAAKLGRELTVDFNRKGRAGREMGPLYAFFNASVQGTARTLESIKGPAGKKIIAGGLMLGVLQALMLAAADFDDDEPPDFVKARAFIIPTGGKRYIAIPLQFGLNVLPNTGRVLTELMMNGGKDAGKKVFDAVGELAGSFNPLGGGNIFTAHGLLTTISPTVIDPIIDIGMNTSFAGTPIGKERQPWDTRPGFQRARESTQRSATGQVYMGISKAINNVTGGNDYKKGEFSPTPEQVQYLFNTVGGGVYRELEKSLNAVALKAQGIELKARQIPLGSRFAGEADDADTQRSRYYRNKERLDALETQLKGFARDGNDKAIAELERTYADELDTLGTYKGVSKAISSLNKLASESLDDPKALAELDKERTELMRELNEAIREAEKKAK